MSFIKQARRLESKYPLSSNRNCSSLKYFLLLNSTQSSHYNILLFQQKFTKFLSWIGLTMFNYYVEMLSNLIISWIVMKGWLTAYYIMPMAYHWQLKYWVHFCLIGIYLNGKVHWLDWEKPTQRCHGCVAIKFWWAKGAWKRNISSYCLFFQGVSGEKG